MDCGHSGHLFSSIPLRAVIFPAIGISIRLETDLILSLQLSLDPHKLLLAKWGTRREKCDFFVLWCVLGSSKSVLFPWKIPAKHGAEGLCEHSTLMSVVQVKSKPACLALQAPPWNSLFRLFSCVAARNVHRIEGE